MTEEELANPYTALCGCYVNCRLHSDAAEWRDIAQQLSDRLVTLTSEKATLEREVRELRQKLWTRAASLYQRGMNL